MHLTVSTGYLRLLQILGLASLMSAGQASAQTYYFRDYVGYGLRGSADGPSGQARFMAPSDVAVDSAGFIYVADSGNNTIRMISPSGDVSTVAGTPGLGGHTDGTRGNALFQQPQGVAVDANGVLYVADAANYSIRKIAVGGLVSTFAGSAGNCGGANGMGDQASFRQPSSLRVDQVGNVYVVDYDANTIRKITPEGLVSTFAGSYMQLGWNDGLTYDARFINPSACALDQDGNLYVTDSYNSLIRKISSTLAVTTLSGKLSTWRGGYVDGPVANAEYRKPFGIAVAPSGVIYVADTQNNVLRAISKEGVVSTLAGKAGSSGSVDGKGGDARFNGLAGLNVDAAGNVYVADTNNDQIRKVTPDGVVTTLAGTPPPVSPVQDGIATQASFTSPTALAMDDAGTVYVADYYNSSLRTISEAGVVSTIKLLPEGVPVGLNGLAVDKAGHLYVADGFQHTIDRLERDGTVTILAGTPGVSGNANGVGGSAQFYTPVSIAVSPSGILYVADYFNNAIRKVTPDGTVTTLAGNAGDPGSVDGNGANARFNRPSAVTVDALGDVYVADSQNHTIRRITPTGAVSTFAGQAGNAGSTDGSASVAQFNAPAGIAFDAAGNLLVCDGGNALLRRITKEGNVSTIGGLARTPGHANGIGSNARFSNPHSVLVDQKGRLLISDSSNNLILMGIPQDPGARLSNISTRSFVGTGVDAQIAGFVISGNKPKTVLIRAAGPSLLPFGITTYLADPQIELHAGNQVITTNDNWCDDPAQKTALQAAFHSTGAFGWADGSKDAALLVTLQPGAYSAVVTGKDGGSGTAIIEVYDADKDKSGSKLSNISTRSQVKTHSDVQIAGFVIEGAGSKTVLIRAAGPGLGAFGLPGTLVQPKIELHSNTGVVRVLNGWEPALANDFNSVGAFAWSAGSFDAACSVSLPPGNYSAIIKGANGETGLALIEIYDEN